MSFLIRKATIQDANDIAVIVTSSWKAAYKDIISPKVMQERTDVDKRTESFSKIISNGIQNVYIILDDEKPCGFCTSDKYREEDLSNAYEIIAMYFLTKYWGIGFAKQTMDFVLEDIKKSGYQKVCLWTFEDNLRARRFYEKCGFEFDGTKKESDLGENLFYVRYYKALI